MLKKNLFNSDSELVNILSDLMDHSADRCVCVWVWAYSFFLLFFLLFFLYTHTHTNIHIHTSKHTHTHTHTHTKSSRCAHLTHTHTHVSTPAKTPESLAKGVCAQCRQPGAGSHRCCVCEQTVHGEIAGCSKVSLFFFVHTTLPILGFVYSLFFLSRLFAMICVCCIL